MRKEDTVRLNCHAVARRIESLDVKQWWLARMIGVDRKTVSRWLTGKVKRVARENAGRLADHLGCDVEEITVTDEADVLATKEEQRMAARLLQEQDLLALLAPTDSFELAERLIKATLMPDLPLRDLGRLDRLGPPRDDHALTRIVRRPVYRSNWTPWAKGISSLQLIVLVCRRM